MTGSGSASVRRRDSRATRNTVLADRASRSTQEIVGVATLVNKRNKDKFDTSDEELFAAFADFCGLALHSATMFEKQEHLAYRCKVALESLSYHTIPKKDEVAIYAEAKPSGRAQFKE